MSHFISFWKNSLIYRTFIYFFNIYNDSKFLSVITTLDRWNKNSNLNKKWVNYLNREPISRKSYFFKSIKFLAIKLDSLIDSFHNYFKNIFFSSLSNRFYLSFKKELLKKPSLILIISAIGFWTGYIALLILKNKIDILEMITITVLSLIIIFLISFREKLSICVKHSTVYKIFQYILD